MIEEIFNRGGLLT